jgi:SAM-dependent methyltransferase
MELVKTLKRVVPRKLHAPLGSARRRLQRIPLRVELQKRRLLSDPSLSAAERDLLRNVSSRIYHTDGMYHGDGAHYFKVGLSAIACIDEVLAAAGLPNPRAILDFPCGSGRVLRFMVQRFPEAEFTACELDSGPVEFCVRTFGARPAFSSLNLDEVSLDRKFDLIWCGSLVTHLDADGIVSLLKLFKRHLAAGGLMIFSTHGDFVERRIPTREFDYGLDQEQVDRIGSDYATTGYGFENYLGEQGYGVSLTSPAWIRARVAELGGLREVYFRERGWDDHQDVFGFVREN